MSALLPCPFCGGDAEFERLGTRSVSCIVACQDCGARHSSGDQDERCGESWNRRKPTPDQWRALAVAAYPFARHVPAVRAIAESMGYRIRTGEETERDETQ